MVATRYYVLHLQQYSHRLNLLYFFLVKIWLDLVIILNMFVIGN